MWYDSASTDYSLQNMKVIDLFCGCGGLSLGFKLAGCQVVYGLDSNRDAIETFRRNFPGAIAVCKKIEDLNFEEIPEADIVVGGPPCVNFSSSKGGRANVLEGVKLVQSFLRFVYYRKPKYWIMENVPRIGLHLPEKIPLRWIGIDEDGTLRVPNRREFDISRYGAPQNRKRLLIGNYPIPSETHCPDGSRDLLSWEMKRTQTLGDVVSSLPKPWTEPGNQKVIDINYGFEMPANEVTDHFMDTTIPEGEARRIRQAKVEHPFMGRMDFPDSLDKPARTVVALQMGRETLVLQGKGNSFRRATIRECALIQTFPLGFQFSGKTVEGRCRQVGNAVPAVLTYQIARGIVALETGKDVRKPKFEDVEPFPKPAARNKKKRVLNLNKGRIIHFPGKEVRGLRIEICSVVNGSSCRWETKLHIGEGKANHHVLEVPNRGAEEMAYESLTGLEPDFENRLNQLLADVAKVDVSKGFEIQRYLHEFYGKLPGDIEKVIDLVEEHFPKKKFGEVNARIRAPIPGLDKNTARIRILASLPVAKILEEKLNAGNGKERKTKAATG